MIYSPAALMQEISEGKIIRNLSQRELIQPEGVGFDLRLKNLAEICHGSGSLLVDTRRTPTSSVVEANCDIYLLQPGKCYLATTIEEFDLPNTLAAVFFPRSTLFRSGVSFHSSVLPPGYVGPMTFSLINHHTEPFEIEKGSRFAHAVFQSVQGDVAAYKGQWQGGRVSQPKNERQK